MSEFISMGEVMMRLTPPDNLRFEQASALKIMYGGDEANVAVSLAHFGIDCAFVTKLPENPFGHAAINYLRRYGINTDFVVLGGDRIGLNFYEIGAAMRPSRVIYDRSGSAISKADADDFDFDAIFRGTSWFHISGITPALGEGATKLTEAALNSAKKHDVTISVDLNYRRKLWSPEKAKRVMTSLMKYVDVCIGNEEDTQITLGLKPDKTEVYKGKLNIEGYKSVFKKMKDTYGFKYIGTTLRESYSASDNGWSCLVFDGREFYHSKKYNIHLVDRGGGGSAFAAGLIYGLMRGKSTEETTEFAAASSALKQTIWGDFNLVTVAEVEELMKGDASGRIQR
jgi:2-dehydro-3-deoxygluconokinase